MYDNAFVACLVMLKLKKHFVSLLDYNVDEVLALVDASIDVKKQQVVLNSPLEGKNLVGIFEQNSTRTANSAFKAASYWKMGYFHNIASSLNFNKESVADTAKVFASYYDAVLYRTRSHAKIQTYAQNSSIPVINALSEQEHPLQTIADLQTIKETFGSFANLKVVFTGNYANNMGISWLYACAFAGMDLVFLGPETFQNKINVQILDFCAQIRQKTKAKLTFSTNKNQAVANADIITTDTWLALDDPFAKLKTIIHQLSPFRIDMALMQKAKPTVKFMHCLPLTHNLTTTFGQKLAQEFGHVYSFCQKGELEVSDAVFQKQTWNLAFLQSQNRWSSLAALLHALIV